MSGLWSIIKPEATENYISNPSFEKGVTGMNNYSTGTGSGTKARSSAWSKRGAYSYLITKSGGGAADHYGAYASVGASDVSDFISGDSVTFSVDLNVPAGTTAVIKLEVTAGSTTSETETITGPVEGRYDVTVGPLGATATAINAYIYVSSTTGSVYADGLQVERKAYATSYADGDQTGCKWVGATHSTNSTRTAQARAGGREYDLGDLGFTVKDNQGTGMPPLTLQEQIQAGLPGALFRGESVQKRQITLTGDIIGTSLTDLHSKRKAIIDALKLDATKEPQAITLRYSGAAADKIDIGVVYADGLGKGIISGFTETDVPLKLIAYDPFWSQDGDSVKHLTAYATIAGADALVRKHAGEWSVCDTGLADVHICKTLCQGDDGLIYVGGQFDDAGGVANTKNIAVYDPLADAFSNLGTGTALLGDVVWQLLKRADGHILAFGAFTAMGGVANTKAIADWDGSAWNSVITAISGGSSAIYGAAYDKDGNLYVTGSFTSIGGTAANNIAKRTPAGVWSALGTGLDDIGNDIVCAQNGDVYVCGKFAAANGVTVNKIARWDGTTFHALGTGLTGASPLQAEAMIIDSDNSIIVGGNFTDASGITGTARIARWTGATWEAMGDGFDAGSVYAFAKMPDGSILVGGGFTSASGLELAEGLALWNRSTWAHLDIDLPGAFPANAVYSLLATPEGDIYVGFDATGTATASEQTTVTNSGTTIVYPKLVVSRSGGTSAVLEYLKNEDTGDLIWLNYSLLDGEKLTLDLTPGSESCVSSYFGTVWRAVLRNSNTGSFSLQCGDNTISALVVEAGSPTVECYLQWKDRFWSFDGVAA